MVNFVSVVDLAPIQVRVVEVQLVEMLIFLVVLVKFIQVPLRVEMS